MSETTHTLHMVFSWGPMNVTGVTEATMAEVLAGYEEQAGEKATAAYLVD